MLQRKKEIPIEPTNDNQGFEGYEVLPGGILEVWIYNTSEKRYYKYESFLPEEFGSLTLQELVFDPQKLLRKSYGDLTVVRLKFINDDRWLDGGKVTGYFEGNPSESGVSVP